MSVTATADQLRNSLASGGASPRTVLANTGLTAIYTIHSTGTACDPATGHPAVVTITVPSNVTAEPSELTFYACSVPQSVVFTGSVAGSYPITHVISDADHPTDTYDNNANFTLIVTPPADTTPPVIVPTVSGTLGSNGWYRSDVSLSWSVTDAQSAISSSTGCGPSNVTADTTGVTFTCQATSGGGTSSQSVTLKRDVTAPVLSGSNVVDSTWRSSSLSQGFTASDATSGLAVAGDASFTLTASAESADGWTPTAVSKTVTDVAGNSSTRSLSARIDLTKPTISGAASPAANGAGWNNTDVTVSFDCADALSGIASCSPATTFSSNGTGLSATGTAIDNAGNSDSATVSGIKIDKTPPTISGSASPAAVGGWNTGDVTVSFVCGDALSGVVACPSAVTVDSDGAGQFVTRTVYDVAGNSASATVTDINLDKTPPIISDADVVDTTWRNTPRSESFTASDATSGLANAGDASFTLTASVESASASTPTVVSKTVTDVAGNSSTRSLSARIDLTPPTISGAALPLPNAAGWNNGDVTVSFDCADDLSGIAGCTTPVTLTSEGSGQSVSGTAIDVAGNSASATVSGIKIDRTPPTVSVTGVTHGESYLFGAVPGAGCSASDTGGSGVPSASPSPSGAGTTVGGHTVTCSSTDAAGNSTTVTTSYTVLPWTMGGFYAPIDGSHRGAAPAGSTPTWNTVKGGSTVPIKFRVWGGAEEYTSTDVVSTMTKTLACTSGPEDVVELTATGGTSLRYDTTGRQFIFNWQTPKLAGKCYAVTVTLQDGTATTAYFKTK